MFKEGDIVVANCNTNTGCVHLRQGVSYFVDMADHDSVCITDGVNYCWWHNHRFEHADPAVQMELKVIARRPT